MKLKNDSLSLLKVKNIPALKLLSYRNHVDAFKPVKS